MTYDRFEQLPVWQAAIKLGQQIYAFTSKPAFHRQRSLRDQIERAAVSISNNIAEGFERGTTQELLTFLYIARGFGGARRGQCSVCWKAFLRSLERRTPAATFPQAAMLPPLPPPLLTISNLKFQI